MILVDALEIAVETIRSLHGTIAWEIYRDQAAEMHTIREALKIAKEA